MTARFRSGLLAFALAAVLAAQPVSADRRNHDEARRAVESGEIRPLAEILAAVRRQLPGEVAGVEIERRQGRWLYEFRVVDRSGRLFDVYIDARTGTIERIREK